MLLKFYRKVWGKSTIEDFYVFFRMLITNIIFNNPESYNNISCLTNCMFRTKKKCWLFGTVKFLLCGKKSSCYQMLLVKHQIYCVFTWTQSVTYKLKEDFFLLMSSSTESIKCFLVFCMLYSSFFKNKRMVSIWEELKTTVK